MQAARYRVWQFWRLLSKRITPEQQAEVQGWLTPELFKVFSQLNLSEQHHAYSVRATLVAGGHSEPDLLTAALLHDVGKSQMPLAVWEKVAIVLGNRFFPKQAKAWGENPVVTRWQRPWRRPFINAYQHPAWGAAMVSRAGASPIVVELVRRHADKIAMNDPLFDLLSALQSADNVN